MMNDFETPLGFACARGGPHDLTTVLRTVRGVERLLNRSDRKLGVTPLMMLTARDDQETAIEMAKILIARGAGVDTRDSGPGVTPLFMAAQFGRAKLLQFFIDRGAQIDIRPRPGAEFNSQPIWTASQNGHAECVATLAKAAMLQGKDVLEARNITGKTPCYVAVEKAKPECVGVLAMAGADLRCVSPAYYWRPTSADGESGASFDPSPDFPVHSALDTAIRSWVNKSCAACGNASPKIQYCGKCKFAYFCNRDCQTESWPLHKKCCGKIKKGAQLVQDDDVTPFPLAPLPLQPGFPDGFAESDHHYDGYAENVELDRPVWEYSETISPGVIEWKRFPLNIEMALEGLNELGAPTYMYRPGCPDAEGRYADCNHVQIFAPNSRTPNRGVASRHVSFEDMVEREVFTGASRNVRRNGVRKRETDDCPRCPRF